MLKNDLKDNGLYQLLKPVADGLGMTIVEVQKNILGASETRVVITVMNNSGQTTVDDLEKFHRSVQSILELTVGRDVLSMEVGTPGLERNLKDCAEFSFFRGRNARIYSTSRSDWLDVTILQSDETGVDLLDTQGNTIRMDYSDIHKARLDYRR